MKRSFTVFAMFVFLGSFSVSAFSDDASTAAPSSQDSTIRVINTNTPFFGTKESNMWTKLGRGLGNLVFGWVEIFNQPVQMAKTERWPIAVLGGIGRGIVVGTLRTLIGIYETASFPFPVPEDYKPILYPEFIIPKN